MYVSTMSYATLLVLAIALNAANAQFAIIQDLQVVGGGERNGYIRATVLRGDGSTVTGPVCGSVNTVTGTFACYSKSLFLSSAQGTIGSMDGISPPTERPVASSLSCNSYSNSNGRVSYGCVFSTTARCSPSEYAAVECTLTAGDIAGIVIGCIIFLLLICVMPCVIVCCCVCGFAYFAKKSSI